MCKQEKELKVNSSIGLMIVLFLECALSTTTTGQPSPESAFPSPLSNRLSVGELDIESQDCMSCHNGSHGQVI